MKVDTDALRAAAEHLRAISRAAEALGCRSGRAVTYIPALGLCGPAQAVDSFLANWRYGVGCLAAQAHALAEVLTASAVAVEATEEHLRRQVDRGGAATAPLPAFSPTAGPEPVRSAPAPNWGMLASATAPVVPQLSHAKHAGELVPGDPEQVLELARMLEDFSERLMDERYALHRISLDGWHGETAAHVLPELEELQKRLTVAINGFSAAGVAVHLYAAVHAEARAQATRALATFQAAKHQSEVFRGVIPGGSLPPEVTDDPGLPGMATAARTWSTAQEAWEAAAKKLQAALADAEAGSPTDPGALAKVTRWASSLGTGLAQGTVGIAHGTAQLAVLGYGLTAAGAIDPERFRRSWEGVGTAAKFAAQNPERVLAALADVKTLKEDPALWAGKLAPEILLAFVTIGASGIAKSGAAVDKLRAARTTIEHRNTHDLWPRKTVSETRIFLDERQLGIGTPARSAARVQFKSIGMNVDAWRNCPLREGQRIAVYDIGDVRYVAVVPHDITRDARKFFEDIQVPPARSADPNGHVSQPMYPARLRVYEVRNGDLDSGQALASANTQFGSGGGNIAYIADFNTKVASGRLEKIGNDHVFDAESRVARYEDPLYREVDPTLTERALDPEHERTIGQIQGAGRETARAAGGAVAGGIYARVTPATEASEKHSSRERDEQHGQ